MDYELENKLVEKHWILSNSLKDATVYDSALVFGLECGNGWYNLIDELCTKIELELLKDDSILIKDQFRVLQIKEKFGSLSFYISSGIESIFDLIDEYENKSLTICERCGNIGTLELIKGWYVTICEECKSTLDKF